jgi:hypothetical protein
VTVDDLLDKNFLNTVSTFFEPHLGHLPTDTGASKIAIEIKIILKI